MTKLNVILAIAVMGLLLGLWAVFGSAVRNGEPGVGAAGGLLAENYWSYLMNNDGYKSENDIETSADLQTTGTLTTGSSGSAVTRINTGTCTFVVGTNTIVASTSKAVDCQGGTGGQGSLSALTGVTLGDMCFLALSTSTPSSTGLQGIRVAAVSASTTAGYITALLENRDGATFTWSSAASSSNTYVCLDL